MRHLVPVIALGLTLVACRPVSAGAVRTIDDVPEIASWGIEARLRLGDDPPLQVVEMTAFHGRDPVRESTRISVSERGGEPTLIESRVVDGRRWVRVGGPWAESDRFRRKELLPLTPTDLLAVVERLVVVGTEERDGRPCEHRRGDREDLIAAGGAPEADFARLDHATIDVWIDLAHRFISEFRLAGATGGRDGAMPLTYTYRHVALDEPVAVDAPAVPEPAPAPAPAVPGQDEVDRKLGFPFPVPAGATVSIYGATVNVLTTLPLDEARAYADRTLRAAGFVPGEAVERAPGEFATTCTRDGRSLVVLVFQVSARGATIQLGAKP
ncbi:hypothetical protein KDM41_09165 [bacterium]|nr:hypothetical protein [bacterium]